MLRAFARNPGVRPYWLRGGRYGFIRRDTAYSVLFTRLSEIHRYSLTQYRLLACRGFVVSSSGLWYSRYSGAVPIFRLEWTVTAFKAIQQVSE